MTSTSPSPVTMEYKLVIVDPESRRVLARRTTKGHKLPRVSIPRSVRRVPSLQSAIRDTCKLDAFFSQLVVKATGDPSLAFAELIQMQSTCPFALVPLAHLHGDELLEEDLRTVNEYQSGDTTEPFFRIGWRSEAVYWLEQVTGRAAGTAWKIDQYNASGTFALIRFTAPNNDVFWMKATGAPNRHERDLTVYLSHHCPHGVPEVIAHRDNWNAWIMRGVAAASHACPDTATSVDLGLVAETIARVQSRFVGLDRELLRQGAADQRSSKFLAQADPLFEALDEAMLAQTSTRAPRIEKKRLTEVCEIFKETCVWIDGLGLPNSLVHGDLSLENIVYGIGGIQLIDWSEAYVGNPLITLEHLLLLNRNTKSQVINRSDQALRDLYKNILQSRDGFDSIDIAFEATPLLAAASALYGRGDWFLCAGRHNPSRQIYARTLARYMDRAAKNPTLLSALGH